jgi:hypothetical protein
VLGLERVGIDDNFFELGGNSLLGIEAIAQVRRALELDVLPVHTLYTAPSPRALAELIEFPESEADDGRDADAWAARADLRREGLERLRQRA